MNTVVLGATPSSTAARRMIAVITAGRAFVNGDEAFDISRTKARRLAYRWRGSRRGLRIASWLNRTRVSTGAAIEPPLEYLVK